MENTNKTCASCMYESQIAELKRDAERNSEQHREFYSKFNAHATSIAISEERYNNLLTVISEVKTSVEELNKSIKEINDKPGKRWESIVTTIISCIVTGVVVYMLARVGLK